MVAGPGGAIPLGSGDRRRSRGGLRGRTSRRAHSRGDRALRRLQTRRGWPSSPTCPPKLRPAFDAAAAGGPVSATNLYRLLANQQALVRGLVRQVPAGISWHHSGVWFGGYNPPLGFPNPQRAPGRTGTPRRLLRHRAGMGDRRSQPAPRLLQRLDEDAHLLRLRGLLLGEGAREPPVLHRRRRPVDVPRGPRQAQPRPRRLARAPCSRSGRTTPWCNGSPIRAAAVTGCRTISAKEADGTQCVDYQPPHGTRKRLSFSADTVTTALQLNNFWPQNYITNPAVGSLWLDDMVLAKVRIGCVR